MNARCHSGPGKPVGITLPENILVTPLPFDLPDEIKPFFGKTGKWWGSWRSNQSKGGFETILVIKRILSGEEASVLYSVQDYPQWYVTGGTWETPAHFVKRGEAGIILSLPFEPLAATMECWFEGRTFQGSVLRRFMRTDILWKPLA
ncbi:MAG: hypothetical protein A4E65_01126 [Syntrophorhabdus sp. PtaU1.Bin153]|nr:MAG: hypothetical protein A4E65_01126 [Syntrophorhabdus sp. PtaU1.Bin153]